MYSENTGTIGEPINDIKTRMMEYRDRLTGEGINPIDLYRANDIHTLNKALDNHIVSMEKQLAQAKSDIQKFREELGL